MGFFSNETRWIHKVKEECRYWLHWGKTVWRYEGYLGKRANHTMIGFDLGGEENDFLFKLGIKRLFCVYFGVEDLFPRKLMYKLFGYDGRIYELSAFEEYICFDFHRDENGYSDSWRGIHWMLNWKEKIFGKWEYKCDVLDELKTFVEMPEGKYPVKIKIKNVSRGYKRAKKTLTTEYEYDLEQEIPFPSKWGSDDDGLFGGNLSASNLYEALIKIKDSALDTRIKRGGVDWKPKNGWKVTK